MGFYEEEVSAKLEQGATAETDSGCFGKDLQVTWAIGVVRDHLSPVDNLDPNGSDRNEV